MVGSDPRLREQIDQIGRDVLQAVHDGYAHDYQDAAELERRAIDSERLAGRVGAAGDRELQMAAQLRGDAALLRARADAGWPGGLLDWTAAPPDLGQDDQ